MPRRLEISRQARRDFNEITSFIAEQNREWGIAEAYGSRLIARCRQLLIAPGAGSRMPFSAARKINEGFHKIYYRADKKSVLILRFWDGRRGSEPRL